MRATSLGRCDAGSSPASSWLSGYQDAGLHRFFGESRAFFLGNHTDLCRVRGQSGDPADPLLHVRGSRRCPWGRCCRRRWAGGDPFASYGERAIEAKSPAVGHRKGGLGAGLRTARLTGRRVLFRTIPPGPSRHGRAAAGTAARLCLSRETVPGVTDSESGGRTFTTGVPAPRTSQRTTSSTRSAWASVLVSGGRARPAIRAGRSTFYDTGNGQMIALGSAMTQIGDDWKADHAKGPRCPRLGEPRRLRRADARRPRTPAARSGLGERHHRARGRPRVVHVDLHDRSQRPAGRVLLHDAPVHHGGDRGEANRLVHDPAPRLEKLGTERSTNRSKPGVAA